MASVVFDRAALLDAFDALGRLAWADGKTIEIAVYGGSALMLSYDWRAATKDVEAALALVGSFNPQSQLQPKVRFGIEEILGGMNGYVTVVGGAG